ncbi:MAG: ATP-binding protein, partial [Rhodoferax sp.]
VHACVNAGRAELTVRDSGNGIAPEMFARLFEAFSTSKPRGAGLGLGLMITQRIVRDFGGQIRAHNHPDGGAVFTIDLPLLTPPHTP